MTPGQVLAAGVVIAGFFLTLYGLVVAISRVANRWAYRYERRRPQQGSDPVGEPGAPATIHPLQFYRARRDRAPRPRRPAA